MSQDDLAEACHVVRQTVSKWEQGRSIPDVKAVVAMAEQLGVSVDEIIGTERGGSAESLAEELARAGELIAEKERAEGMRELAGRKRGLILLLSFLTLAIALIVREQIASLALIFCCVAVSAVVLYRSLPLLTSITTDDPGSRLLKLATIFDLAVFSIGVAAAALVGIGVIGAEEDGRLFAMVLVACVMVFSGIVSPKLPFSRHTGLRLPWTVVDEDTWNVAHRTLGFTALPVAILYVAGTFTIVDFEMVTLGAILVWVGLPSLVSYAFYHRKTRGRA